MSKLVMVKMTAIEYKENEDLHTIGYSRAVKNWMSQWTVVNNFSPIVFISADEEESNALKLSNAKRKMIDQHINTLKSVLSGHTKAVRYYEEDFVFRFEIYEAEEDTSMRYKGVEYHRA